MTSGIDSNIWSHHNIIANLNFTHIQDYKVIVSKEPLTNLDVITIVTMKWRFYPEPSIGFSKDFSDQFISLFLFLRRGIIVFEDLLLTFHSLFTKAIQPRFIWKIC